MMKKIIKYMMILVFVIGLLFIPAVESNAAQMEANADNPLAFEIAIFEYEVVEEATQEDMPVGFALGDWEYNGVAVKAGFTENSDMVCVMGKNLENGNQYRFIYDPEHEMFVPYFGTEIKNGYIYTVPMYEGAEVPYGFVESYFVIQTVPMFTYMREDAELTQEEIAVGSLSEDNYLVFLMRDETGKEVHYTYDLVDRTFQRALLQKKDAEKVTELNETIDKLSEEIGKLNATHAERMNGRLTIIGILIAAVIIMVGVIINLLLKISKLKKGDVSFENEEEDDDDDDDEPEEKGGLLGFFKKREELDEEDELEEDFEVTKEEIEEEKPVEKVAEEDDELVIFDLDLEDL